MVVDVDDWDAPCRRPDPMIDGGVTGVLDVPEPPADPGDLNPYHAPATYNTALGDVAAVTLEAFFPVSAPHRMRSSVLLRNVLVSGLHIPNLLGAPQLFNVGGSPVPTTANGSSQLLMPTPLPAGYIDPTDYANPTEPNPDGRGLTAAASLAAPGDGGVTSAPILFPGQAQTSAVGVRVSFDDPTAQQDQDWSVTYEGALPTVMGIAANIDSTLPHSDPAAYQSLTFSAPGARFCARGIEDWTIGQVRANTMLSAMDAAFAPSARPNGIAEGTLPEWTSDYVEVLDDPLPNTDGYWTLTSDQNDCWDPPLADPPGASSTSHSQDRYNFCEQNYGPASTADTYLTRDLPIIHAHDDSLEVGRFGWYQTDPVTNAAVTEQTTSRVVVGADPTSVAELRRMTCCFHHQATFKVRTGGEWVAVGSVVGLLHQVVKKEDDPSGSCVLSCDPRMALMNARSFDVPWSTAPRCSQPGVVPQFDRDSPLAMRNPMFSFIMWGACAATAGSLDHTLASRDLAWKFSMRGGFSPLTVPLVSATTGSGVDPQSMRFIDTLGQLAVVDSESQGLVLIDLNLVAVAHNYF